MTSRYIEIESKSKEDLLSALGDDLDSIGCNAVSAIIFGESSFRNKYEI
jgi:hypothetical protein